MIIEYLKLQHNSPNFIALSGHNSAIFGAHAVIMLMCTSEASELLDLSSMNTRKEYTAERIKSRDF